MASGGDKDACVAQFRVKFQNMTADEFVEAWNKYDKDGNGYIEGKELEFFFKDCIEDIESDESLHEAINTYMKLYDENNDNKIEMTELAEILKPEQNFLLLFRSKEAPRTAKQFYEIWLKYDANHDGFIDSSELKNFLKKLSTVELPEEKLDTYADAMLKLFDVDKDNKLSFKEMLKLIPVKENIFLQFEGKLGEKGKKLKFSTEDFSKVFQHYKDAKNVIRGDKLSCFLRDLVVSNAQPGPCKEGTLEECANQMLALVDTNDDKVISENELKMFLGVSDEA